MKKEYYTKSQWETIRGFSAKNGENKEDIPGWIRVLSFVAFSFCFYVVLATL